MSTPNYSQSATAAVNNLADRANNDVVTVLVRAGEDAAPKGAIVCLHVADTVGNTRYTVVEPTATTVHLQFGIMLEATAPGHTGRCEIIGSVPKLITCLVEGSGSAASVYASVPATSDNDYALHPVTTANYDAGTIVGEGVSESITNGVTGLRTLLVYRRTGNVA